VCAFKGEALSTNAFLSPRWGGMLVYNVNVSSHRTTEQAVDIDMRHVLSVFAFQLRLLLGIHSTVDPLIRDDDDVYSVSVSSVVCSRSDVVVSSYFHLIFLIILCVL